MRQDLQVCCLQARRLLLLRSWKQLPRAGLPVKDLLSTGWDLDKVTRARPAAVRMESVSIYFRKDAHWLPKSEEGQEWFRRTGATTQARIFCELNKYNNYLHVSKRSSCTFTTFQTCCNHPAAPYSYPATCTRDKISTASFTHPMLKMGRQPDPVAHTYPAS